MHDAVVVFSSFFFSRFIMFPVVVRAGIFGSSILHIGIHQFNLTETLVDIVRQVDLSYICLFYAKNRLRWACL